MFCRIHMNVNVFLVPTPLVRKTCKGIDDCLYIYIYSNKSQINV
jgi:hypothetical protein